MRGVYRCCLPDAGTTCCSDAKPGMCFAYGGVLGTCAAAGETYEAKDICAQCCEGLENVHLVEPGDEAPPEADHLPAGCDEKAPPSLFLCIQCGDGACGAGENVCNCPSDCK